MLCNMFPKVSPRGHFNQSPGEANHVEIDIEFTCTMYTSPDINMVAQLLINKYRVLTNALDFTAGIASYDSKTGYYLDNQHFPDSTVKDWTMK